MFDDDADFDEFTDGDEDDSLISPTPHNDNDSNSNVKLGTTVDTQGYQQAESENDASMPFTDGDVGGEGSGNNFSMDPSMSFVSYGV